MFHITTLCSSLTMFTLLRTFYQGIIYSPIALASHQSSNRILKCFCSSSSELLRIIGKDGNSLGFMTINEANKLAVDNGLVLSKVADKNEKIQNSVYKLIEESSTVQKQFHNKQAADKQTSRTKELTLKTSIDINDMKRKSKKLQDFLENGYHVTIRIAKPGRSKVTPRQAFDNLTSHLTCGYKIPNYPKESEKNLRCTLIIDRKKPDD